MVKKELLQKIAAEDVLKNKKITFVGQMFIEYEKEFDNSKEIIKRYEDCIGDIKNKNDRLDKVSGDNVKKIASQKDEVFKNKSIN